MKLVRKISLIAFITIFIGAFVLVSAEHVAKIEKPVASTTTTIIDPGSGGTSGGGGS